MRIASYSAESLMVLADEASENRCLPSSLAGVINGILSVWPGACIFARTSDGRVSSTLGGGNSMSAARASESAECIAD